MKLPRPATILIALLASALVLVVLLSQLERHTDSAPRPRDLVRATLKGIAMAEELYAAETGNFAHPDSLPTFEFPEGIRLVGWTADSLKWEATLVHEASGTTCTQRAAERLEAAVCSQP